MPAAKSIAALAVTLAAASAASIVAAALVGGTHWLLITVAPHEVHRVAAGVVPVAEAGSGLPVSERPLHVVRAIVGIDSLELREGSLPPTVLGLVIE
jgi:hypothetical protein